MTMIKLDVNSLARATPCVAMIEAWHDDTYIVQVSTVYDSEMCDLRFNVRRKDGTDGITWDEIMRLKKEIGRDDLWGVELFPPEDEIMNNMNARHIFLLKEMPDFAWHTTNASKLMEQCGCKK